MSQCTSSSLVTELNDFVVTADKLDKGDISLLKKLMIEKLKNNPLLLSTLKQHYAFCFFTGLLIPKEDVIPLMDRHAWRESDNYISQEIIKSKRYGSRIRVFKGKYFSLDHVNFVTTRDTKLEIPYTYPDAYRTGDRKFYESDEKLEYCVIRQELFHEDDMVLCYDTGLKTHKDFVLKVGNKPYMFAQVAKYDSGIAKYGKDYDARKEKYNYTVLPKDTDEHMLGIEFEFGNAKKLAIEVLRNPDLFTRFASVRDGSLDNIQDGLEFVSIPLKLNELHYAEDLLKLAKECGATCDRSCGFHVHVSAVNSTFLDVSALVTLCTSLEKDIFNLLPKYRQNNNYCKFLNENFRGFLEVETRKDKKKAGRKLYDNQRAEFENRHKSSKYVDSSEQRGIRYYWLNLDRLYHKRSQPEQRTFEFRPHQATFDSKSWINFCLLCYYLVQFAKTRTKEICSTATLQDVVDTAKPFHRKQLTKYIS